MLNERDTESSSNQDQDPSELRATRRAHYDAQVLVIGAGPAGLAAALRARWVKGYHALPASVVVFDPGHPGGLLRWGGCILTGPSWSYSGAALNQKLLEDVEKLNIPIVKQRVLRLDRTGDGGFVLTLESQERWTGRAVILAGGFRRVGAEEEDYQRGVRITYKGYDHFPHLLATAAQEADGRGLLVVGNSKTTRMANLLAEVGERAGGLTLLLENSEPPDSETLSVLQRLGVVVDGRLEGVRYAETPEPLALGDFSETPRRLAGARIKHRAGGDGFLACGSILLDYNAFELSASARIEGIWPPCDARGFVQVDALMHTGIPGVFAAGDITGRYASTLVALGDGVSAGFSAYRHVFVENFGYEPHLFAYRADDQTLPAHPRDLPDLPDDAVPIVVGHADKVHGSGSVGAALDDRTCVGALRRQFGREHVDAALFALMDRKDIAIHRPRVGAELLRTVTQDSDSGR